jgi:hypothetical protein
MLRSSCAGDLASLLILNLYAAESKPSAACQQPMHHDIFLSVQIAVADLDTSRRKDEDLRISSSCRLLGAA